LKSQSNKLVKLEAKYVKVFKENKAITKDRDSFINILRQIFDT